MIALKFHREDHMTTAAAIADTAAASNLEVLHELNHNYVRSVEQSDVRWFDENLAADFLNSNPDGTLVDRAGFLEQIAKKSLVTNIAERDVRIVLRGDFAFIHALTTYTKPNGEQGRGRYTDVWWKRNHRWLCVSAHVTRA
jgi:ketosteroid isomerase-like protein